MMYLSLESRLSQLFWYKYKHAIILQFSVTEMDPETGGRRMIPSLFPLFSLACCNAALKSS